MNQVLFYLLQVIAASGLLYGYYHFALRNKKFHRYNRFYLLMAVITSAFIPFLNIPVYFSQKEAESSVVLQTLQVISSPSLSDDTVPVFTAGETGKATTALFTTENVFTLLYLFILSFFLLRVLISLNKIRSLIKRHTVEHLDKIRFINTDEQGTPFSFFRWLFWNRKIELHSDKGEQVFRHELFHIQQKHSWDIIFMELVSTIFWVNPFFHLIKKEVKAIHEFLADEFAIRENKNWQYAELLLMQVLNTNNRLVNPFFHNQIKRRIAMITTSQKPSCRYLRKIMVLPVAAAIILLFAFTYKNKQSDPHEIERSINSITVVIDAGHGGTDPGARTKDGKYNEAELSLAIAKNIEALSSEYNITVIMTRQDEKFPDGAINKNEALRKRVEIVNNLKPHAFVTIHMNTTSENGQASKSGFDAYITSQRYNYPDKQLASSVLGELKKVYTTREEIKQRGNASIYVIDQAKAPSLLLECGFVNNPKDLAFVTNEKNQEKIARAILKGLVTFSNNVVSKKEWDDQYLKRYTVTTPDLSLISADQLKKVLIVVDGIVQSERGFSSIDSNLFLKSNIEELRFFTDKPAIDKYGDKAKDGVIEIDTKENHRSAVDTIPKVDTIYWIKDMPPPARKSPTQAELNSWSDGKIYGVWIDARRISNNDLKSHKSSEFGWYNVSKLTKTAINYGKHYYQVSLYTQNYYDNKIVKNRTSILVKDVVHSDSIQPLQPLIVVNGTPMPGLTLNAMKKMVREDDIENIVILKDKTAIDKYGDKGKNGVLEVKAKKFGPVVQKDETTKPGAADNKIVQDHDNKVFVKVEVEPSFPGGETAWRQFLDKNLNLDIPVSKNAPAKTYTVILQFVVDREGNISDLKALTNHGYGIEEECLRAMSMSPKWKPATQNGHIVKAYKKQPVTLVITGKIPNLNKSGFPVNVYLISPEESSKIDLADLKKVKQLTVQKTGSVQSFELTSFKITIDKPGPGKFLKEFVIKGNKFPDELVKIINDLDSETYITIEDIDVKIDGRQKRLPPRIYRAVQITTTPGSHPSSWNSDDPEFKRKWRDMISEVKAMAWKEGKAAYVYKGRTYVFGRITNPDSTVASFTEQNGTDHVFLLNNELINSADELNALIKRSDVKRFGFLKPQDALNRFNRKDAVVFIETYDEVITKN